MLWLRDTKDFLALAKRIVARPGPCDGIHGIYDCDYCPISEKCTGIQATFGRAEPSIYFKAKAQAFSAWLSHTISFGQLDLWEDL